MANKLVRVTFDAVKGHETDKGVCYYRSNDKAGKETILRKSQIVQEIEIGLEDKRAIAERELKRLRSQVKYYHNTYRYYSANPDPQVDTQRLAAQAKNIEDRIAQLTEYLQKHQDSESRLDEERYEYAIVVHGKMFRHTTKEGAEQALEDTRNNSSDPDAITIIRRPVGEWEEYGNQ